MKLKKKFRLVFDPQSREIIFASEFKETSTTSVGHGRASAEFNNNNKMQRFIIQKGLTFQPENS